MEIVDSFLIAGAVIAFGTVLLVAAVVIFRAAFVVGGFKFMFTI